MGKETKIPALTRAETKKLEGFRITIEKSIVDLADAVSALYDMLNKDTKNKDLKEFNEWLLNYKLGFSDDENSAMGLIRDLALLLDEAMEDIDYRSNYQKVYRKEFGDLGFDYASKEDVGVDKGYVQCPTCGAWLFDSEMDCPECGRKSKIVPFPAKNRDLFEPFKTESGLTIDPMLLTLEEMSDIFRKYQTPVVEEEEDEDGWNQLAQYDNTDCVANSVFFKNSPYFNEGEPISDDWSDRVNESVKQQAIEGYEKASDAIAELSEAIELMETGPAINNMQSSPMDNFAQSVYYGWVFKTFFDDEHSHYNLKSALQQLRVSLEKLKPHLNNTKDMVMVKVQDIAATDCCFDEAPHTTYMPLEDAKVMARICPNCGLWVDNEIDICDCGEWLDPVTPKDEVPESIELAISIPNGFTAVDLLKAFGGGEKGFFEGFGEDCIRLNVFGESGYLGCSTAYAYQGSGDLVGDDYDWVDLVKLDKGLTWVVHPRGVCKALSESPAVVEEAFLRLYKAVSKLLGKDYGKSLIEEIYNSHSNFAVALSSVLGVIYKSESRIEIDKEDFDGYVEWLIEKKGNKAAFEFVSKVYQKDAAIVGNWVQKLGEDLTAEIE